MPLEDDDDLPGGSLDADAAHVRYGRPWLGRNGNDQRAWILAGDPASRRIAKAIDDDDLAAVAIELRLQSGQTPEKEILHRRPSSVLPQGRRLIAPAAMALTLWA